MIYILMIWTAVAASDSRGGPLKVYHDWRPLGAFETSPVSNGLQLCEAAAKQLGIKHEMYRCVRSR